MSSINSINESLAYGQQTEDMEFFQPSKHMSGTHEPENNTAYANNYQNDSNPQPDIPFSLVQRGPPLLMGDGKTTTAAATAHQYQSTTSSQNNQPESTEVRMPSSAEVIEVLHTLLPPITLKDKLDRVWKQYCATPVSNRTDVYRLQDALDAELIERQARPYGICPVRELLYSQSFDELLRQVALESPERGLMILRVRDQLRMSIACYQTLFHNSTNFGTKRAVMGEKKLLPYENKIKQLLEKKSNLQAKVYDLKDKLKIVEEYEAEQSELQRNTFNIEKSFVEEQIAQLRSFLRTTGVLVEDGEDDRGKSDKSDRIREAESL
jgi:dynein light intermediate chain